MFAARIVLLFGLLAMAVRAYPSGPSYSFPPDEKNRTYDCGEANVIFTGLPPYHPLVTSQGFNSSWVNEVLRADAASMVKAGYNTRVVLMGPEQDISVLSGRLDGTKWDGTGIGYGVRGSSRQDLTIRVEDIVGLYRRQTPQTRIIFNYSPFSALWAAQRRFPLARNCTNSPGRDLGFEIYCDPSVCTQT